MINRDQVVLWPKILVNLWYSNSQSRDGALKDLASFPGPSQRTLLACTRGWKQQESQS